MAQLTEFFYPFAAGLAVFEDFTPASRPQEELYWDVLSQGSGNDHTVVSVFRAGPLAGHQRGVQRNQRSL